jgi:hypothetical protein
MLKISLAASWRGPTKSIPPCRNTERLKRKEWRRLLAEPSFASQLYSDLSSTVKICKQSGRSNMQSNFAIAVTAFSTVDVRHGSVVMTNGSRFFG